MVHSDRDEEEELSKSTTDAFLESLVQALEPLQVVHPGRIPQVLDVVESEFQYALAKSHEEKDFMIEEIKATLREKGVEVDEKDTVILELNDLIRGLRIKSEELSSTTKQQINTINELRRLLAKYTASAGNEPEHSGQRDPSTAVEGHNIGTTGFTTGTRNEDASEQVFAHNQSAEETGHEIDAEEDLGSASEEKTVEELDREAEDAYPTITKDYLPDNVPNHRAPCAYFPYGKCRWQSNGRLCHRSHDPIDYVVCIVLLEQRFRQQDFSQVGLMDEEPVTRPVCTNALREHGCPSNLRPDGPKHLQHESHDRRDFFRLLYHLSESGRNPYDIDALCRLLARDAPSRKRKRTGA
ncbi:MAG: hypothetical protein M1831_001971 [Alyxoria varia]|nr:MAG: hypothetical protein M1831_001971 [Alyxoria varia]